MENNWNIDKIRKFISIIVLGYFGTKLLYKIYGTNVKMVSLNDELMGLIQTVVLGIIMYYLTNIEERQLLGTGSMSNIVFFAGLLIGINGSYIYDTYIQTNYGDIRWDGGYYVIIMALIITALLVLFTLTSISNTSYNMLSYIIYIGLLAGVVIWSDIFNINTEEEFNVDIVLDQTVADEIKSGGTVKANFDTELSSAISPVKSSVYICNNGECVSTTSPDPGVTTYNTLDECKAVCKATVKYNYRVGLAAWFMSLVAVSDSSNKIINRFISLVQGFLLGLFISSFANKNSVVNIKRDTSPTIIKKTISSDEYVIPIGLSITLIISYLVYDKTNIEAGYIFVIGCLITALIALYLRQTYIKEVPNGGDNTNSANITLTGQFTHINRVYIILLVLWVIGFSITIAIAYKTKNIGYMIIGFIILCVLSYIIDATLFKGEIPKIGTDDSCPTSLKNVINTGCGTDKDCLRAMKNCSFLYADIEQMNIVKINADTDKLNSIIEAQRQSGQDNFNKMCASITGDNSIFGDFDRRVSKLVMSYITDDSSAAMIKNIDVCVDNKNMCACVIPNPTPTDSWIKSERLIYEAVPMSHGLLGRFDIYSNVYSWWKILLILIGVVGIVGGVSVKMS